MGDTDIGTPYRMELNISLVLWRGRKRGKGGREGGREEGGGRETEGERDCLSERGDREREWV